ncbi:MAG: toxic anion resistance protein [Burkholderiales bacterium]|nr:toxic anion resistance protein [Burkholderiales bacterium]
MTTDSSNSALPVTATASPVLVDQAATVPALEYIFPTERQTDLSKFDAGQMARVEQIAASVSFADTNSLLSFGTEPQRRLNDYLDQLLDGIRTSDVGAAGDLTIELATTIKAIHLQKMKREVEGEDWVASTFGRLPVVGKWASALRYFQLSHKQITKHLETIETRAEQDKAKLAAMNAKLDRMVDASIENMRELEYYLAAAQVVIKRARVDFEQRRQAAAISRDVVEIARLRDYMEQINAFETRAVRMHVAYAESMVSIPQIRASQTASRIEISNIMDTMLFDLPHLKRAIVQVASLAQTSKASKANAARRELTRQISGIGADQLQEVYLKAKASQGSSEQDIALLAQSADKLLETIALGHKLDAENARKREQAIQDVTALKHKFVDGLIASGDAFVAGAARG